MQVINIFTRDYSAWYGTSSWMTLALLTGLGIWGYRVATAGRPLFDTKPA
jgi:hypothetical protein